MAIAVPTAADAATKWATVTPQRASYYTAAASVAGDTWQKNATAAKSSFVAGVTNPNIGNMFAGGIKQAGAGKYNTAVSTLGAQRFGPGVQAAQSSYQTGEAPMLDTIASVNLSPRGTRGSPQNYQRVTDIGTALNKKRAALRAAGS